MGINPNPTKQDLTQKKPRKWRNWLKDYGPEPHGKTFHIVIVGFLRPFGPIVSSILWAFGLRNAKMHILGPLGGCFVSPLGLEMLKVKKCLFIDSPLI